MEQLGWDELDVILVSGDSYIDSPYIGTAVIGKVLANAGYRVGVIAQPDTQSERDITRLGEPSLFWGVSAGSVDSMVANYTALKKKRRSDDYTPGGLNERRPDRATIVYANLIRRHFKQTQPIVLGGIEASLRRITHYDFWSDQVRGSVLLDAKADYLLYGMAERAVVELAGKLRAGESAREVRGLCFIANEAEYAQPEIAEKLSSYVELPTCEVARSDKLAFIRMFHLFYQNNDPITGQGLYQKHGGRCLVQNPPTASLSQAELDAVYALDYERAQHPYYERQGKVKALETIQFSIPTHRGCYGECNFCAIAVHEGRTVQWRSSESILEEARQISHHPEFKGVIPDLGGPTANMYGFECKKKLRSGACPDKQCLYPEICKAMKINHRPQIELLRQVRHMPGVRKVFVASGIRYDLLLNDAACGQAYLQEVVAHHVSGQMKIAPEHTDDNVLRHMGKPSKAALLQFKEEFEMESKAAGKPQFLTYYLIAAHPGCTEQDMQALKRFTSQKLQVNPEQVQIFTPTPSTYSSLMYHTELDPFTLQPVFVEKDPRRKQRQKEIIVAKSPPNLAKGRKEITSRPEARAPLRKVKKDQ
jgi:uncharacterized radical SAM protein YgiQ